MPQSSGMGALALELTPHRWRVCVSFRFQLHIQDKAAHLSRRAAALGFFISPTESCNGWRTGQRNLLWSTKPPSLTPHSHHCEGPLVLLVPFHPSPAGFTHG